MPAETNFEAVDGDTRQRVRERLGELLLHDPNNLGQYSLLSLSILAVAESPGRRQEAWEWFQDNVVKEPGSILLGALSKEVPQDIGVGRPG